MGKQSNIGLSILGMGYTCTCSILEEVEKAETEILANPVLWHFGNSIWQKIASNLYW